MPPATFLFLAVNLELMLEISATVTGVCSVCLLARGDGRGWALGLLALLLAAAVYWMQNLLGSTVLQVIFLALQALGWWRWRATGYRDLRQECRFMTVRQRVLTCLGFLALWAAFVPVLIAFRAELPVLDGLVTDLSIMAQVSLVLGHPESWLLWILTNLCYIGLSLLTQMWFFVVLYAVYCTVALKGWSTWTRESAQEKRTTPAYGDQASSPVL